jgi:hypothetical protein
MSPEEINIAIAEACGFHAFVKSTTKFNAGMEPCCDICEQHPVYGKELRHFEQAPNFCGSLDAMHEAEKTLTDAQRARFQSKLELITGNEFYEKKIHWSDDPIHATAAQRAEAFLRAKNLWKESPQ